MTKLAALFIFFITGMLFEAAGIATGRKIFTLANVSLMGLSVWFVLS